MLVLQLGLSFLVWIASGVFIARRSRRADRSHASPGVAAALGTVLFILSAVVLVGGLFWVAQTAGPVKSGLATASWVAITGLGALFTAGQAEAAGLILSSVVRRSTVTEESPEPSGTSGP